MVVLSFSTAVTALILGTVGRAYGLVNPLPTSNKVNLNEAIGNVNLSSRRQALLWGLSSAFLVGGPANAFANKISDKYDDRPKRRGPKPKDLGLANRMNLEGDEYVGLKECGAAPNCFSSTMSVEVDSDHSIPAWTWPKDFGDDKEKAFQDLKQVIEAYEPGQNGVDAGGFEIQTFDAAKGYMYTQFEALKHGYIDDVEFVYTTDGGDRAVQVRSSSRVGYLDYNVNAKRLNYIAAALRSKGWAAVGVDFDKHRGYVLENQQI